jgi:GTP pyrophosphokinase
MKTASWHPHYKQLMGSCRHFINQDMVRSIQEVYKQTALPSGFDYKVSQALQIAHIAVTELGLGNSAVVAILLYPLVKDKLYQDNIEAQYNVEVATILRGMDRIKQLYSKTPSLDTENFRKLLLTLAEDVRVIMIMLADRLHTMRHLSLKNPEKQQYIARETAFLYAPMAHRMGLYKVKTEMEDLSMKYTVPSIYKEIASKLAETKRERDKYMRGFEKRIYKQEYDRMSKLTLRQGMLLIRLVDRECDATGYELIKAYRGSFTAGFYQMFAKMFGASLKTEYGSHKDDATIERIINLVESGQL